MTTSFCDKYLIKKRFFLAKLILNEAIVLQVGGNLIRFALHLLPMVLPTTKNGLRLKP